MILLYAIAPIIIMRAYLSDALWLYKCVHSMLGNRMRNNKKICMQCNRNGIGNNICNKNKSLVKVYIVAIT